MESKQPTKPSAAASRASFGQRLDTAAVLLVSCAVVWAPLAYGASGSIARLMLQVTGTVAALLWSIGSRRSAWPMLVPFCVAGLLCFQLMPLPDSLLVALAPVSGGAWKVAREGAASAWSTISIDPGATSNGIRSAFLTTAILYALIALGRVRTYRTTVIASLAIAGALILGCGLCQIGYRSLAASQPQSAVSPHEPSERIAPPVQTPGFGVVQVVKAGDYQYRIDRGEIYGLTGPYLYANHFAGGVCLTLPVLIAGCVRLLRGRIPAAINWGLAIGLAACGIWAVAVFARSRAGTASLVVALLVLFAAMAPKGRLRLALSVLAGLAFSATAALLLLLLGAFGNPVAWLPDHLKPFMPDVETDARAVSARVAVRAFLASPILGTGLDTYADVFPRFYRDGYTLFYAHNDYAQFLAECGLVGAALLALATIALLLRAKKFFADAAGDYRLVNSGVWAGLIGIGIHSAFDWNLHLPANCFLTCVAAAMAYSSVPPSPTQSAWAEWIGNRAPLRLCQVLLAASLGLSAMLFIRDAVSDEVQQTLRRSVLAASVVTTPPDGPAPAADVQQEADQGQRVLAWDPSNSHLLITLGHAHLHMAANAATEAGQEKHLNAAALYFTRARQASAMIRGMPEREKPVAGSRK